MNRGVLRLKLKAGQVRIKKRRYVLKYDALKQTRGKPNQLADWLQQKYGYTREQAEKEALK